ncbi:condensin complex subunit 3-like [Planoprotostelium fungivorum]|uniref:Condensin complex subunit 3-like n=1 Tax=Planoprotostelium fungivorum TaxID=1890364 RepID=A0A2P6NE62_9EUKA|nr:condensin complex subunit 3-like [Planoprotostelium fungivorum]
MNVEFYVVDVDIPGMIPNFLAGHATRLSDDNQLANMTRVPAQQRRLEGIRHQMCQLLDQAQRSLGSHARCAKSMVTLFRLDPALFRKEFFLHIKRILSVGKREPSIERLVVFVVETTVQITKKIVAADDNASEEPVNKKRKTSSKNASSKKKNNGKKSMEEEISDEEEPTYDREKFKHFIHEIIPVEEEQESLAHDLINYLLPMTNAKDKGVRFRTCNIIAGLMKNLTEIELEEEMTERVSDKHPAVRVQAVDALSRLQDATKKEDRVTQLYIKTLRTDTSVDVRKAVISAIQLTALTLPIVMERLHDVSDEVRKHLILNVGRLVPVAKMKISFRIELAREGLMDKSPAVRKVASQMITNHWMKSNRINGSVTKLLEMLDIEANPQVAQTVLMYVFKDNPNVVVEHNWSKLTKEDALIWRMHCNYVKFELKDEDKFESLVPETTIFAKILASYQEDEYILEQLLLLGGLLDFADEAGRREFRIAIVDLLLDLQLSEKITAIIMKLLRRICSSSEFMQVCLESISEINDPLEGEKQEGEGVMLRCLEIAKTILQNTKTVRVRSRSWFHPSKGLRDPGAVDLLPNVILKGIQSPKKKIREASIIPLGLCCLYKKEVTRRYSGLLLRMLESDCDSVKIAVVKVICDLLIVFGLDVFEAESFDDLLSQDANDYLSQPTQAPEEKQKRVSGHSALVVLSQLLVSDNSGLQMAAVETVVKLLLAEQLGDMRDKMFSKLLLLFGGGINTPGNEMLHSCLEQVLQSYCNKKPEVMRGALVIALDSISKAPKSSNLYPIQLNQFCDHLMQFVPPESHPNLCEDIIVKLHNRNDANYGRLTQALSSFKIPKTTPPEKIKSIKYLTERLLRKVTIKEYKGRVEKFLSIVSVLDTTPGVLSEQQTRDLKKRIREDEEEVTAAQQTESTPAKTMTSQEKKQTMMEKQAEYFGSVDDYELEEDDSTQTKKKKRESQERYRKERDILKKQNENMKKTLELLRQQLAEKNSDKNLSPFQKAARRIEAINVTSDEDQSGCDAPNQDRPPEKAGKIARDESPREKTVQFVKPNTPEKKKESNKKEDITEKTKRKEPASKRVGVKSSQATKKKTVADAKSQKQDESRKRSALVEDIDSSPEERDVPSPQKKAKVIIPDASDMLPSTPLHGEESPHKEKIVRDKSTCRRVVVSFTGFRKDNRMQSLMDDLADRITLLGGEARLDDAYDAKITHMVCPHNTRTSKTMAAHLTQRWVIDPSWIIASTEAGYFVLETEFSQPKRDSPFKGKKVWLSNDHTGCQSLAQVKAIVTTLGRGSIVEKPEEGDILVGPNRTSEREKYGGEGRMYLSWNEFYDLIQPPEKK